MKKFYLIPAALIAAGSIMAATPTALPPRNMERNIIPTQTTMLMPSVFNESGAGNAQKAPSRADEQLSIEFGYCGDPYTALQIQEGGDLGFAIELPTSTLKQFVGNKITGVMFAAPANSKQPLPQGGYANTVKEGTIFLTNDLKGTPVASKTGTLGNTGFIWNTIKFDQPIEITDDKPIYVGIQYSNLASDEIPLIVDGQQATTDLGVWINSQFKALVGNNLTYQEEYEWKNLTDLVGSNLCIRVVIEGDNLDTNKVSIDDTLVPTVVAPNKNFTLGMIYHNMGANRVNSVDVTMEIEGQDPQTVTFTGETGNISYNNVDEAYGSFICKNTGNNIPYTLYISKVNGSADNMLADQKVNGYLLCLDKGFERNVLVEELTGTWCAYCPIGYAGMEQMRESYGMGRTDTGRFIGIGVHASSSTADPMDVCGRNVGPYYNFALSAGGGVPASFIFRNFADNVYPHPDNLAAQYSYYVQAPAFAKMDMSLEPEGNNVTMNVSTTFSLAEENAEYGIAYTITEDEVGPYVQYNAYSGQPGNYFGFESKPQTVPLMYNDVARLGSVYNPIANSIPSKIEKDEAYQFSTTVDLSHVKNKDKAAITAILINKKTNLVENATRVYVADELGGVEKTVADSKAPVAMGLRGSIVTFANADIYASDGRMVARNVNGTVNMEAGIYFVRTANGTAKVLVR